jgi:hypothetical protein
MRQEIFFPLGQLGQGGFKAPRDKDRVIAKASRASGGEGYGSLEAPAPRETPFGRALMATFGQGQGGLEIGLSTLGARNLLCLGQLREKLLGSLGIRKARAPVTGRENTRCPAQGLDAKARVVGQGQKGSQLAIVGGFKAGVFSEALAVLQGLRET